MSIFRICETCHGEKRIPKNGFYVECPDCHGFGNKRVIEEDPLANKRIDL